MAICKTHKSIMLISQFHNITLLQLAFKAKVEYMAIVLCDSFFHEETIRARTLTNKKEKTHFHNTQLKGKGREKKNNIKEK